MFKSSLLVTIVIALFSLTVTNGLNFLALGDWGGQGSKPYYTTDQKATSVGMGTIGSSIGSEFVLALGDNFYSSGITSESDARFSETFETIYTADSLQTPWYVLAGNHDHYGNVTGQIEYTASSERWTFPSEYHSHSFTSSDGSTIDIIMIDTVDLAGISSTNNENEPGYFDPLPLKPRSSTSQWTWIEAALQASTADYLLVAGHYPVYSVCEHGNTATLVTNLKPLLTTYGAHYLSGHDHCMEHIVETGSDVNYYIVGMGVECCYSASNLAKVPTNSVQWYIASNNAAKTISGGFASFNVTSTEMVVTYYNQDGNVLYTAPGVSPRSR
eukprot:gene18173-23831_t